MEAVIIGNPNSGSAGDEGYLERFAKPLRVGGRPRRARPGTDRRRGLGAPSDVLPHRISSYQRNQVADDKPCRK